MFLFFAIILATCFLTSTLGLFCSVLCRKTSAAMILTYVVMLGLFFGPIAVGQFLQPFTTMSEAEISQYTVTSPFSATFSVPLHFRDVSAPGRAATTPAAVGLPVHWIFLGFAVVLSIVLLMLMDILFRLRWRAAAQGAAG
jgi:hypothetical protein